MAELIDFLPRLQATLAAIPGVTRVYDEVPARIPVLADLPAIVIDIMPPALSMARTTVRRVDWPVDLYVFVGIRTEQVGSDLADAYPWPDKIKDALDLAETFGGVLARPVQWREEAFSVPNGEAFGPMLWDKTTFIGTVGHPIFAIDRVGGF